MNVKLHPVSVGHVDLRLSYELALRAFVVIWLLPTVVVISEAAERLLPHRSLSLSVCPVHFRQLHHCSPITGNHIY